MMELERRVSELVNLILDEERRPTSDATEDVGHWDSLKHLSIIAALEQEFAVQIPPEESRKLRTIRSICAFLSRAK